MVDWVYLWQHSWFPLAAASPFCAAALVGGRWVYRRQRLSESQSNLHDTWSEQQSSDARLVRSLGEDVRSLLLSTSSYELYAGSDCAYFFPGESLKSSTDWLASLEAYNEIFLKARPSWPQLSLKKRYIKTPELTGKTVASALADDTAHVDALLAWLVQFGCLLEIAEEMGLPYMAPCLEDLFHRKFRSEVAKAKASDDGVDFDQLLWIPTQARARDTGTNLADWAEMVRRSLGATLDGETLGSLPDLYAFGRALSHSAQWRDSIPTAWATCEDYRSLSPANKLWWWQNKAFNRVLLRWGDNLLVESADCFVLRCSPEARTGEILACYKQERRRFEDRWSPVLIGGPRVSQVSGWITVNCYGMDPVSLSAAVNTTAVPTEVAYQISRELLRAIQQLHECGIWGVNCSERHLFRAKPDPELKTSPFLWIPGLEAPSYSTPEEARREDLKSWARVTAFLFTRQYEPAPMNSVSPALAELLVRVTQESPSTADLLNDLRYIELPRVAMRS